MSTTAPSTIAGPSTLIALSPSSARSSSSSLSLTSSETSFDHESQPPRPPHIPGLRDLTLSVKAAPAPQPRIQLLKAIAPAADSPHQLPFARQVEITGWKIVGGRSFEDLGKVGAYVVYDIEITLRAGGSLHILRRYTDFVDLRKALKTRYPKLRPPLNPAFPPSSAHTTFPSPAHTTFPSSRPGLPLQYLRKAIPPLPGKAHMCTSTNAALADTTIAKFSAKFLAERQPRLQRFLKAVMLHPEMGAGGEGAVVSRWVVQQTGNSTTQA
ncbi:hypothetical protein P7C73_g5973, partial [Tremellales sp. Uapishka_1]